MDNLLYVVFIVFTVFLVIIIFLRKIFDIHSLYIDTIIALRNLVGLLCTAQQYYCRLIVFEQLCCFAF